MNITKEINSEMGFFSAYGSFGAIDATDYDRALIEEIDGGFASEYDYLSAVCSIKELQNGVFLRKDSVTANKDISISRLCSRFLFEGGDYEIYTQYSNWMHESEGGWANLVTEITAENNGVRTTEGAAPMLALKNKSNGVITVFHIIPNCAWKMAVKKHPVGAPFDAVLVELGFNDRGLNFSLSSGETVELPEIICYRTKNDIDFDAYKVHTVYNKLYPRRSLPIIYNSWLYKFNHFTYDDIVRQADTAAELGIEMFLIDAGWFGKSDNWCNDIGVWVENTYSGFKGRLSDISRYVRDKGMKFGLWIEPERAVAASLIAKSHPEYFVFGNGGNCFLDFSREDARNYIIGVVCELIEKYSLSCLKFDFNASLSYDSSGSGFYRYFEGQRLFIDEIRRRYPDIYITNCASGGNRMDMGRNRLFDSVWISDNQSPVRSLKIIRDTLLRLPSSNMERWDVRRFESGIGLSCDDATWTSLVTVSEDYTHNFIKGGVMGFSADIASYPEDERKALKGLISEYKRDREFFRNATARILYSSSEILAIQYSDESLNRLYIQVFCRYAFTREITVYPAVSSPANYVMGDRVISSEELMNKGISVSVSDNDCKVLELHNEK